MKQREQDALFHRYLSGRASPGDIRCLEEVLRGDPAARRELLMQSSLEHALRERFAAMENEQHTGALSSLQSLAASQAATDRRSWRRSARRFRRPGRGSRILWRVAVPAAAAVICIVAVYLSVHPRPASSPPALTARVTDMEGRVEPGDGIRDGALAAGDRIRPGEAIATGRGASATLVYPDGSTLHIRADTIVTLDDTVETGGNKRILLRSGSPGATASVRFAVSPQPDDRPLVVLTPHARTTVVGTRFTLVCGTDSTDVAVAAGAVRFAPRVGGRGRLVTAGQRATIGENAPSDDDAASTAPPFVEKGLIARYRFDRPAGRTIADSAPHGDPLPLLIETPERVRRLPGGGIALDGPACIVSTRPADTIAAACMETGELAVVLWLRPRAAVPTTTQIGMQRIVTMSLDPTHRNFSVGQGGHHAPADTFAARLRTAKSKNINGLPDLVTRPTPLINRQALVHLVYTHTAAGLSAIWINGERACTMRRPGSFANWSTDYHLVLGQEYAVGDHRGDGRKIILRREQDIKRAWLGELYWLGIYNRAWRKEEIVEHYGIKPHAQ